ncbi:hypothetical protein chiPu_0029451 [Chiloscyllium punctatum]|uniref:Uncharacterized protein n=1 Tax=Chiloscyllium punctatum TaxID=137246 RepID=A0A401TRS6_CHIPU|nr:hypothetical protein [Chiloscyllium punctatum]
MGRTRRTGVERQGDGMSEESWRIVGEGWLRYTLTPPTSTSTSPAQPSPPQRQTQAGRGSEIRRLQGALLAVDLGAIGSEKGESQ